MKMYSIDQLKEFPGTKLDLFKDLNKDYDMALPQDWLNGVATRTGLDYEIICFSTVWVYPESKPFSVCHEVNRAINQHISDLNYAKCPGRNREPLKRYIEDRIEPGGFLMAVLSNDLRGALERADNVSMAQLVPLVTWIYWEAPATCWGSPEAVAAWLSNK